MEQTLTDSQKTTLILTSSPTSSELESLKNFIEKATPLLLNAGGKIIKRTKLNEYQYGHKSFVFLLIMDFASKIGLEEIFDSEDFKALLPSTASQFIDINILQREMA